MLTDQASSTAAVARDRTAMTTRYHSRRVTRCSHPVCTIAGSDSITSLRFAHISAGVAHKEGFLKNTALALIAVVVAAMPITLAQGNNGVGGINGNANAAYAIGLWGDLPYSAIQESVGLPNLIADMNSQQLAFTVHDGDLKTGNAAPICNDALYTRALGWFNSLEAPAIFTPGDNDRMSSQRRYASANIPTRAGSPSGASRAADG